MNTKKAKKPMKKLAKQERSKATIETILQAATQVLIKNGYEGTNTNRIAEVAGVSIGSIYQYFSNKEDIIAELIDRHIHKIMGIFVEKFKSVHTLPLKNGIEILIRAMIEARSVEPKLRSVFSEQLPKIGKLNRLRGYENQAVEMMGDYLELKKRDLTVKNIALASFFVVYTVEGILKVALNNRQDILISGHLEAELTTLVMRYLTAGNKVS